MRCNGKDSYTFFVGYWMTMDGVIVYMSNLIIKDGGGA